MDLKEDKWEKQKRWIGVVLGTFEHVRDNLALQIAVNGFWAPSIKLMSSAFCEKPRKATEEEVKSVVLLTEFAHLTALESSVEPLDGVVERLITSDKCAVPLEFRHLLKAEWLAYRNMLEEALPKSYDKNLYANSGRMRPWTEIFDPTCNGALRESRRARGRLLMNGRYQEWEDLTLPTLGLLRGQPIEPAIPPKLPGFEATIVTFMQDLMQDVQVAAEGHIASGRVRSAQRALDVIRSYGIPELQTVVHLVAQNVPKLDEEWNGPQPDDDEKVQRKVHSTNFVSFGPSTLKPGSTFSEERGKLILNGKEYDSEDLIQRFIAAVLDVWHSYSLMTIELQKETLSKLAAELDVRPDVPVEPSDKKAKETLQTALAVLRLVAEPYCVLWALRAKADGMEPVSYVRALVHNMVMAQEDAFLKEARPEHDFQALADVSREVIRNGDVMTVDEIQHKHHDLWLKVFKDYPLDLVLNVKHFTTKLNEEKRKLENQVRRSRVPSSVDKFKLIHITQNTLGDLVLGVFWESLYLFWGLASIPNVRG